jgi:HEAT repeat protein
MGKRRSVDEKLAELSLLRQRSAGPESIGELRSALRDKSNLVVAAAARIVGDQSLRQLTAELEQAFARFMVEPATTDKLCRAKTAVVQALDKMEHETADVFLLAARHAQFEPVWGGSEDTAVSMRALAILALLRLDYHGLLPLLVDSLCDPEREVRTASAQALGLQGSESARLVLRLKAKIGDHDPEVLSECLSGLLASSASESLPFVSAFLQSDDSARCEAAILALGRSRLAAAFGLLSDCLRTRSAEFLQEITLAMAMLRVPAATDFLLRAVAANEGSLSSAALDALLLYRHDPVLRDKIEVAVAKSASAALKAKLNRASRQSET